MNTATLASPTLRRLMVATDFSARSVAAFRIALDLCTLTGASLSLLHVFEYANTAAHETGGPLLEVDSLLDEAHRALARLVRQALLAGIDCEARVSGGIASPTILDALQTEPIDLVVLGTNAPHGYERLVCRSTANAVVRNAPCPVLTVGPQSVAHSKATAANGPVIFATDFNETTAPAIIYAHLLANATGSPLHCIHVLPRMVNQNSRDGSIPRIVSEALQHIVRGIGATNVPLISAVTYGSEVSNSVIEYARERHASLIVLGIRQATLLKSHLPPQIADRIVAEARCPVLTRSFASRTRNFFAAACI
jgi:nucleotide-binding universal stress UspA family protein